MVENNKEIDQRKIQSEKIEFVNEIIEEQLLKNIFYYYEYKDKQKIDISIGQANQIFLSDLMKNIKIQEIAKQEFSHQGRKIELVQIPAHQQHISNLCGYHSSFSIIAILTMLKEQNISTRYLLNDPVAFWKHHFDTTKFLYHYAIQQNLLNKVFPFDEFSVRFGDYENTFNKVCFKYNPIFLNAIKQSDLISINSFTYHLQLGRLHNSVKEIQVLQQSIQEFINWNENNIHKILILKLAITSHWTLFFAHKCNNKAEYYFLDSTNKTHFNETDDEIEKSCKAENLLRISQGKKEWKPLKLRLIIQTSKDIMLSLNLIMDCLTGKKDLLNYYLQSSTQILYQDFINEHYIVTQHLTIHNRIDNQLFCLLQKYIKNGIKNKNGNKMEFDSKLQRRRNSVTVPDQQKSKQFVNDLKELAIITNEIQESCALLKTWLQKYYSEFIQCYEYKQNEDFNQLKCLISEYIKMIKNKNYETVLKKCESRNYIEKFSQLLNNRKLF